MMLKDHTLCIQGPHGALGVKRSEQCQPQEVLNKCEPLQDLSRLLSGRLGHTKLPFWKSEQSKTLGFHTLFFFHWIWSALFTRRNFMVPIIYGKLHSCCVTLPGVT